MQDPSLDDSPDPPDEFWDAHYDDLRRIAHSLMGDQKWTRQPTELVNDAYLRERRSPPFQFKNRSHFRAAMAKRLRQVYLDEWKRRTAAKRDSRQTVSMVDLDLAVEPPDADPYQLVTLTFEHLEIRWPGLGRLYEQRVFGELTIAELAERPADPGRPGSRRASPFHRRPESFRRRSIRSISLAGRRGGGAADQGVSRARDVR